MFKDCKIIKVDTPQNEYIHQTAKRGQPDYVVSRSDLVDIGVCPHKWRYSLPGDDSTKSTDYGTLIDILLLNGDPDKIAVYPESYVASDKKTKPWNWNSKTCRSWRESQAGKIVISKRVFDDATFAVDQIKADPTIHELMDKAQFQVWIQGIYSIEGVDFPVKSLIDIVPALSPGTIPALADLKTTKSAKPKDYARTIYSYGYHVQSGMYLDMWNAAMPDDQRNTFYHVIQENTQPYEIAKRRIDNNFLKLGRAEYQKAMEIYAYCLKSGNWPSYDDIDTPSIVKIDGWTAISPEPWMILYSGVEINDDPDWAE